MKLIVDFDIKLSAGFWHNNSMFVRFVVDEIHPRSGRRLGVLHAIRYMVDDHELDAHELKHVESVRDWFNLRLERPDSFSRRRRSDQKLALSWFRDSAHEHISKMREMAAVLERHGRIVHELWTDKPGYIVYEDEHQVAAEPFAETGT